MFNLFQKDLLRVVSKSKRVTKRTEKLCLKEQKVMNLYQKATLQYWKTLRTRFDLIIEH